ncbi:hypothetical protein STAIW_v1c02430 [Spiroplasma taiwanense CT-1]|uniref:Uncharacterized protein n=1 Tax=Spiroplasma taiwanense CT-1 TaxID=1276220 RepID=S5LYY8_9MOLU|nr:hypothetical protein STAIW_v1c02430 [Spiroplasma taiwanense CT-1]
MKKSLYSVWNLFSTFFSFDIKNKKVIIFSSFLILSTLIMNVIWLIILNMKILSTQLYLWSIFFKY